MNTSRQWWAKTKADPALLIAWLKDQYHGEATAAIRIKEMFLAPGNTLTFKQSQLIHRIAREEKAHAKWVKRLLLTRGVTAEILQKEERYWDKVLTPDATSSTENLAAVAYHAETMRLERIKTIANDWGAPKDIRMVFKRILPMELKHAEWFKELTTNDHIDSLSANHQAGLNALGLVI